MGGIPTISRQMCGDLNDKLNAIRRRMNDEVIERVNEHLEKKKALN